MTADEITPLALLSAFQLEDGRRWGEVAEVFQREDAAAVFDQGAVRRHNLLRGRGMSKTTDVAGVALALLLTQAPARSRSYIYASDTEQAGLFMDALAGFVSRTPGLAGAVEVGARLVTVRQSGASLSVETSDGASAFGLRPWLIVVDELGVWPNTANHRRLWSAIVSALPKVPGSRLVVIGTAGSPTGLGAKVWTEAEADAEWRAARNPGPSPWWTPAEIAATQRALTASEWRRLILCEWAEGEDSLTTPEDVEAALRAAPIVNAPRPGVRYFAALDLGTRRDLSAFVIGHSEQRQGGRVTVVDRLAYWRPGKGKAGRVDLAEVEESVRRTAREYGVRAVLYDRHQAEGLTQGLERSGIHVEEFVFSASSVNNLARGLYIALRDRALELPDDAELREQFLATQMVETATGVKLRNPVGAHDDIPTVVGMLHTHLLEQGGGRGGVTSVAHIQRPTAQRRAGDTAAGRRIMTAALRQAERSGPRLPGGAIIMPGTANDPERVARRGAGLRRGL